MEGLSISTLTETIEQIPAVSDLIFQINEIDPQAEDAGNKLQEIIAPEPLLQEKVLKIVNSIYYSFPNPIASIDDSVTVIGFEMVKDIMLAITFIDAFSTPSRLKFDRNKVWVRSLALSQACKLFAEAEGSFSEAEVRNFFIAGLMHALGVVVLEIYFPLDYVKVLKECATGTEPFSIVEKRIMQAFTHEMVGKTIAERWGFPDFLISAIQHHYTPADYNGEEFKKHLYLIHLSLYAVELAQIGNFMPTPATPLDPTTFELLNIDKEKVKELTLQLLEQKEEILKMVNMLTGGDEENGKKKKKKKR